MGERYRRIHRLDGGATSSCRKTGTPPVCLWRACHIFGSLLLPARGFRSRTELHSDGAGRRGNRSRGARLRNDEWREGKGATGSEDTVVAALANGIVRAVSAMARRGIFEGV